MSLAAVFSPEGAAAVLLAVAAVLFVLVLILLVNLLGARREGREALQALVQRQHAADDALLERISQIKDDLARTTAAQSTHFANFLQIEQAGRDSQEGRLERISERLASGLQSMQQLLRAELTDIRASNDKTLADMRRTVDEKLQTTLNARISESFKTVEEQLSQVHKGLGEMREMARNVDGLRRVLTNVKTRGVFGEMQLSLLLQEILTPEQYCVNVATRPNSNERVEFAVKLPGADKDAPVLLPIDAKFPLEDYQRLVAASEACDAAQQAASLKALQTRILTEAQKIRDKYVEVPYTTEFAVMYLPVESLWSEVLRVPGLVERVQRDYHVAVTGPSALAAFLNSLQMGFRTLAIERKSAEVWRLLGEIKSEFGKFSEAVATMQKRLDGARTALESVRTRTNVMSRRLRGVESGGAIEIARGAEGGDKEPEPQ